MSDRIEFSGVTTAYVHKWKPKAKLPADTKIGLRKVWYLDTQWSTCPSEVEDQVSVLWQEFELQNDHCIIKTSLKELVDYQFSPEYAGYKTDAIVQYARDMGLAEDEEIIINYWW